MKTIICPNCHCTYTGTPRREARGSAIIGLLLCLFFLVPGLMYMGLMSGYRYYCPKCGIQVAEGRT